MAATISNPLITVIKRCDENLMLTYQDISKAFYDGDTVYHIPKLTSQVSFNERDTVRRALTRTTRLVETLKDWRILPSSTTLGPSMLSNIKGGMHFPEVTWRRRSGVPVRHWLRMQQPLVMQASTPGKTRFVTGTCLFGKSGAVARLADGSKQSIVSTKLVFRSPIEKLTICDRLSFYEVDTACRLSSVIGGVAEALSYPAPVYVHIPVPEYVLFMLGHQRGIVNDVMVEWLDAVEARGAVVAQLFQHLLARQSSQLDITVSSPLDAVLMPFLRSAIADGVPLSPNDLADLIHRSNTTIGRIFGDWLNTRKDPSISFYDLAHFGYSAGVVLNSLAPGLTIEIENPSEGPIFRAASRVIKSGWRRGALEYRGNLMAVYPYEQMIANFETDLEWRQTIRRHSEAHVIKNLVRQYGASNIVPSSIML